MVLYHSLEYSLFCVLPYAPSKNKIKQTNQSSQATDWTLGTLWPSGNYAPLEPNDLKRIYSVDFAFFIFTLLLADSYWDFKKMKLFW
jgi:hypothetical protein